MSDPWLKEGGPAFPSKVGGLRGGVEIHYSGMTLRDWFAGQVLAGLCSRGTGGAQWTDPAIATISYRIADAMLAERAKEPKP